MKIKRINFSYLTLWKTKLCFLCSSSKNGVLPLFPIKNALTETLKNLLFPLLFSFLSSPFFSFLSGLPWLFCFRFERKWNAEAWFSAKYKCTVHIFNWGHRCLGRASMPLGDFSLWHRFHWLESMPPLCAQNAHNAGLARAPLGMSPACSRTPQLPCAQPAALAIGLPRPSLKTVTVHTVTLGCRLVLHFWNFPAVLHTQFILQPTPNLF